MEMELLLLHQGLSSRTTWVSRYQKGKTFLDLNEARDDGVLWMQWHQLDHMQTICTSLQTDNHIKNLITQFYRQDALPDAQAWKMENRRQFQSSQQRPLRNQVGNRQASCLAHPCCCVNARNSCGKQCSTYHWKPLHLRLRLRVLRLSSERFSSSDR